MSSITADITGAQYKLIWLIYFMYFSCQIMWPWPIRVEVQFIMTTIMSQNILFVDFIYFYIDSLDHIYYNTVILY